MINYEDLQNGSDIRGIATDANGIKSNLTKESAKYISAGFAEFLKQKYCVKNKEKLKIAIGMDPRISGPVLKEAVIESIINLGIDVYDCDMATTPSMFMTTILDKYNCHGSIMITASHLPYYYNGMKFFTKDGGCEKEDISKIISIAKQKQLDENQIKGKVIKVNIIKEYSSILVELIRKGANIEKNYNKPLDGFKIVVDAGNGSGGFFASEVLEKLGADISGSQFLNPDGRFPNHVPNPENKEAMKSIKEAVLINNADLGIIFDTDVDRAAVVDSSGKEINRNALIALISAIILEEHPNSIIVTDSVTSTHLSEFINNLGGKHHPFKRGYKNVINEAIRLNKNNQLSELAIETSGHAAMKENYFLDDGSYLIAKILIKAAQLKKMNKSIGNLIEDLKEPIESSEFRIEINEYEFRTYGENIIEDLKEHIRGNNNFELVVNNYEGVRVNCINEKGWFLLRVSLHEPVLVLNIEVDVEGKTKDILNSIKVFLRKYDKIKL